MRHYRNSSINGYGWIRVVCNDVVNNILKYKEKEGKNNSYFGSSHKYLNEEALYDQQHIEQDKNYKWDVKWNVLKHPRENCTVDNMDDKIDCKISDKPCQIINPKFHSCNGHRFSNFLLLFIKH